MMFVWYFQLDEYYDYEGKLEDCQFLIMGVMYVGLNNYQVGEGVVIYVCSFICICKKILYWLLFIIVKLIIIGLQIVVVVGLKGEEIYMDSFGCVKVQFLWDWLGECN